MSIVAEMPPTQEEVAAKAEPVTFQRTAIIEMNVNDLRNAIRGNVWVDPNVPAIRRDVPFSRRVRVSTVDIAFTIDTPRLKSQRVYAETPPEVVAWIKRWDAGEAVEPIKYALTWEETE